MKAERPSRTLATDEPADELSDEQQRSHRLRFELIFGSLWLAFGLFLLPAVIFWVGSGALGTYGENAGLSKFYIDFYGDLADASGRAWSLALGPFVLMYLLRAVFIGVKSGPAARNEDDEDDLPSPPRRAPVSRAPVNKEPAKRAPTRAPRVEPRMGSD